MGMLSALMGGGSSDSGASSGALVIFILLSFAYAVVVIAATWKVFTKAGQKGWLSLIPILNVFVLIRIVGREGWWVILWFIPCVNIVVGFVVSLDLARVFGRSTAYGVGVFFLPFIFLPMLGFGPARYEGDTPPLF